MPSYEHQVTNWYVCPVCYSPNGYFTPPNDEMPDGEWYCFSCGRYFDKPEVRSG